MTLLLTDLPHLVTQVKNKPLAKFIVPDWGIKLTLSPPVRDYEFGYNAYVSFAISPNFESLTSCAA
jgi:hypothetical protein